MVKPGYKLTEIGEIPEDWELGILKDAFFHLEAGVSVHSDESITSNFYVLKTSAVRDGIVNLKEAKAVVPSDYNRLKCPVKQGTLLISRMNTPDMVGDCGYSFINATNIFLPDRLWQIEPSSHSEYDFRWINYLLNTDKYKAIIRATATGTSNSMKNIAKDRLLNITVPKPTYLEQERIAEALSDVDRLIASLEKMIAKKKAIKQGAMQRLLTGKTRLPGFSGEWVEKPIGSFGSLIRETINPQTKSTDFFWEYSMPAFDESQNPVRKSGIDMHSNRIKIEGTVLLFNKLNVRQKRIWLIEKCKQNSVCSSEFLPYFSERINLNLLKQILYSDKVTSDFIDMSTGTSNSQKRITPRNFLEYKIYIPTDIKEQKAVADIFEDIDSEIESLEQKLAKTRQLKQGMMQQLLTGKIRLV